MTECSIKLSWNGPVITPLQSDTIFGHMAWAIVYCFGESKLTELLKQLETNPEALLVSAGMPDKYLPYPSIPGILKDEYKEIEKSFLQEGNRDLKTLRRFFKFLSKQKYFSMNILETYCKLSSFNMIDSLFKNKFCPLNYTEIIDVCENCDPINRFFLSDREEQSEYDYEEWNELCPAGAIKNIVNSRYHNRINRITGNVDTGGLYSKEETWFNRKTKFKIYIKSEFFNREEIEKIWKYISISGFGQDASSGAGSFDFTVCDYDLPEVKNPNAVLLLGSAQATEGQKYDGWWQFIYKSGKTWGQIDNSEISKIPYKVPLNMFAPGSVFKIKNKNLIPSALGGILKNIHPDERIIHYGYGMTLGVKINA